MPARCIRLGLDCGDEHEDHARHGMRRCQASAEACRRCEMACNNALSTTPA